MPSACVQALGIEPFGGEQEGGLLKPARVVPVNPLPQTPEEQVFEGEHKDLAPAGEFYSLATVTRFEDVIRCFERDVSTRQNPLPAPSFESESCEPGGQLGRTRHHDVDVPGLNLAAGPVGENKAADDDWLDIEVRHSFGNDRGCLEKPLGGIGDCPNLAKFLRELFEIGHLLNRC